MNKHMRRYAVAIVVALVALIIIFLLPTPKEEPAQIDFSKDATIASIGELATVKGFYHNVAKVETQADEFVNDWVLWPFGGLTKVGYKQHWYEYNGIVETGVDISQLRIEGPDENNIVKVFIPDAKVLSISWDRNSETQTYLDTGLFTDVTYAEKNAAYTQAQATMLQGAENDEVMLSRAKNNVKLLIEKYIINTGKNIGVHYTVEWLDS